MSFGAADPCLEATRELRMAESGQQSLDQTFDRIVAAIANRLETDVGSLYLFEPQNNSLVLVATVGLLQSCVGQLRMQLHEGLVGFVGQQRVPVVVARAPQHPRFKYFPEADEDEYQSFLGVPIIDGEQLSGVLVVQTIEPRSFSAIETDQLIGVADLLCSRLRKHTI